MENINIDARKLTTKQEKRVKYLTKINDIKSRTENCYNKKYEIYSMK